MVQVSGIPILQIDSNDFYVFVSILYEIWILCAKVTNIANCLDKRCVYKKKWMSIAESYGRLFGM